MAVPFRGRFGIGGITQNANTVINCLIPPRKDCYTVITTVRYSNGGTTQGHTLTFLKPVGKSTLSVAATAGQKVCVFASDPAATYIGPNGTTSRVAAVATTTGDYLVFQLPDGTFYFDTANSSYSASSVTMTSNFPTNGVAAGASVWNLKVTAATDPWTARAMEQITAPFQTNLAGTNEDVIQDVENGLISSNQAFQPMIVQSNNISVAGTIDLVAGVYSSQA